jgi:hypothetical protein
VVALRAVAAPAGGFSSSTGIRVMSSSATEGDGAAGNSGAAGAAGAGAGAVVFFFAGITRVEVCRLLGAEAAGADGADTGTRALPATIRLELCFLAGGAGGAGAAATAPGGSTSMTGPEERPSAAAHGEQ